MNDWGSSEWGNNWNALDGTLNGLHGTIRMENGTQNGLNRTIGTVNGTQNGLYGTILWCRSTLQGLYDLLSLSGSREDFKMIPPYFCISKIISPWKRTWPFFWTIFNSFHPRMICTKIWLKLKIVFNVNTCKYGFPYCGPSRPPGTMIWTILNLHYIKKL